MSEFTSVTPSESRASVTVSFGERFQASDQFDVVFREGMDLVERTAAYLDGQGRKDSKSLKAPVTALYATESMRLTTRLLDLASWLLIRRSLKEGEISEAEARTKRQRVKLKDFGRPAHIKGYAGLPDGLRALIEESFLLHDRIVQLDKAMQPPVDTDMAGGPQSECDNPVARQMALLRQVYDN